MIKKSLVWLYSAVTYLLWAMIIIIATVVLGVRYLILPNIQQYKADIAREASSVAGQKITIGNIKASWDGLNPHLDLYQVDLYDAQNRVALSLDHIETSLSWLSLPLREARLSSIVIHQPTLTVRREKDGTLYVAGISMSGPAQPEFPNWLLRQSSIDVLDASVVWQDDLRHAPPLALEKLTLRLSSPAWESFMGRHRFGLRATPSVGSSQPIDIRGNVTGKDVGHPEAWSGTVYARVEGTDIAAWRTWLDYPFDLREGFGASQFWLKFAEGSVSGVTSDVLLQNVRTRFSGNAPEAMLRDLSGRLIWQRQPNGQLFEAERLRLSTEEGLDMRNGKARIKTEQVNGKTQVDASIHLDEAVLEQLTAFAGYLPANPAFLQALNDIAPKGRLHALSLGWRGDASDPAQYSLRGNFDGLGINAYRGVPGFTHVSGSIDANQSGGTLNLSAKDASLDLKNILRQPIPADNLSGQVQWANTNGMLEVKVSNLAIANPHIAGTINASYRYGGKGSGDIDLTAKLGHADGKFANYYYPMVMGKDTQHWLDTSVLGGRAEDISVIMRGNLDEFPWNDSRRGLFQVKAKLSDGILDYATDWPRIEGARLNMLFQGNRMEINADQGHLLGNQITRVKAVIPVLDAEHPVLELTGELQGPAEETLNFVNRSPVLTAIDRFTEDMHATGNGKLTLGLHIPLDTSGIGSKVKGSYLINNGSLTGSEGFPPLEHINGRLEFTESTLRAQNIAAQVYGSPVTFGLENGKDGQLRVLAQGRIGDGNLRQMLEPSLADKLHGTTDWTGEIRVRKHQAEMIIKSTLSGLASSLPSPFDKNPAATLPLRIEKKLQGEKQDIVSLNLGTLVSAKLLRQDQKGVMHTERGEINFGGSAELPLRGGLSIKGTIDHVDLDQWQGLLGSAQTGDAGPEISGVNLALGTLDLFGRRINDLKLNAKPITDGWQTTLQSQEITGETLWLRSGHGKVVARLKSLTVPAAAPAKLSDADAPQVKRETDYPALDIVAESFEVRQKKLGHLELLASPQGADWNIEKLAISNPESTLTADGEWRNWKNQANTRLNLAWNITDIGKTLERFGYPDTVKGGTADLKAQLSWPGSPHEFSVNELGGTMSLDTKRGQFLKIQPGVGRLLGVVSLQSLPRRLTFDFRDIFSEGFAFDQIAGNMKIERGVMRSDDFRMEGPAAKVAISGETDLNHETQNLHIKVMPALTDSLALAALAGGPAAGAAAWVAQKILRDPLNKLAAYEYDIGGTWDNPQEMKSKNAAPASTPSPLGK